MIADYHPPGEMIILIVGPGSYFGSAVRPESEASCRNRPGHPNKSSKSIIKMPENGPLKFPEKSSF